MYIKQFLPFFQAAAQLTSHTKYDSPFPPQCPIDLPLTCQNHTIIPDSCCFEYPGGIFLQTQFWDYVPSRSGMNDGELEKELGPLDSFTIHGLWPDNCRGGFEQFCDDSLAIDDVYYLLNSDQFNNNKTNLEISGKQLLEELNRLWKSNNGNDESLWIHEYNKHGTCIKTIRPSCYSRWEDKTKVETIDYKKQAVYDYFRIAYNLHSKLNTTAVLEEHGIVPSLTKTYTRQEIQTALDSGFNDHSVFFACDRHQSINEVWYYHVLKGSLLNQEFVPIGSLRNGYSRCPEKGIKFYPKGYIPSSGGGGGGNGGPKIRGVVRLSGYEGFLIKNGHWMTKGTPANFELIKAPFGNYYLKSRIGYCGLSTQGVLMCNKSIQNAGQFEYNAEKGGYLGYSGTSEWSANSYPRGNAQSLVYHDADEDAGKENFRFKLKFIKK